MCTSALLFFASREQPIELQDKKNNSSLNRKIKDMLFIGFMQALALIPGLSRSGTTISAGCMRGWHIKNAVAFSYILAIPTILGGNVLEVMKLYLRKEPVMIMDPSKYIIGFAASFIVGMASIRYIFSITSNKKLLPVAWYCLILGILSLIYFNLL
jgi:undecaprenyl-diphosphatase